MLDGFIHYHISAVLIGIYLRCKLNMNENGIVLKNVPHVSPFVRRIHRSPVDYHKKIFFVICGRSELTVEHIFWSSMSPWRLCGVIFTSSTTIVAIARTTLTRNATTSAIDTEFILSKIESKRTWFINHERQRQDSCSTYDQHEEVALLVATGWR